MFLEHSVLYCEGLGFLALGKNVLNPQQNKKKKIQIYVFMMPPTFPICDTLSVMSGKGLCTNETLANLLNVSQRQKYERG